MLVCREKENLKRHPLGLGCMSCWDTPLEYNKEKSKKYININHVMNECWSFGSCRLDILEILPLAFAWKIYFLTFHFLIYFFITFSNRLPYHLLLLLLLLWVASSVRKVIVERAHMGTINYVEPTCINFHFLPKLTWLFLKFILKLLL